MKRTELFLIIICLTLLPNLSIAQDGGVKITGYVTDAESGHPVVGVNVIIEKNGETTNPLPFTGTATNNEGLYTTDKIPEGHYIVVFRSMGYSEKREEVNVSVSDGTLELSVKLKPNAVELEEVVVRDEMKKEKDISVISVSPKVLSLLPTLSGETDIFRSLQLLPGVKVASEMSSGIYVRGGSPDQNLTLVDGAMIYNPSHLGNIASTFNTYAIHDVKLIKGAFPAEYGGRLSSVLDIKLREGSNEKEKGVLGIGVINSFATLEGPISDNITYIVSGRVMYYDFVQRYLQKESVTPRYNFYDINTKLNYQISKDQNVSLNAMYSNDNVYNPPINLGFEYNIKWSNALISANWLTMNNHSFISNITLSYTNYKFQSSLDDVTTDSVANDYFSSSTLQDFELKHNLEFNFTDDYTFKTGYQLTLHNYELVNWILFDPILETSPDHSENLTSYELAAYVQNEWRPFALLTTNLGLRIYKFSNDNNVKFEPRLSIGLNFTKNITLKAAYAEAHQFLHLILRNDIRLPTDLWYPSSYNISPAKSRQAVAGIDITSSDMAYLFTVEGYYKDFENIYEFTDLPDYSLDNRIEDLFTKGKGEAYGIEVFLNKRAGSFTGWIGYTISWTRRLFEELNASEIFSPRYDRRHDVSIVFAYELTENLNMGITWTYSSGPGLTMPMSKYYLENPELDGEEKVHIHYSSRNEYKLPDYHKLDFNIRYTTNMFSLPIEFYLNLHNVYNRKNAFAQYVAYDFDKNNNTFDYSSTPKLQQITLMPFIPTFGFTLKF